MGLFRDMRVATTRSRLQAEFEERVSDIELEAKREFKKLIAAKEDRIAELEAKLARFTKTKWDFDSLEADKSQFKADTLELDLREKRLELREEHLEQVEQMKRADFDEHHSEVLARLDDAKNRQAAAKTELDNAKSASRKAGYDEGYAAGLKEGLKIPADFVREDRKDKTSTLTAAIVAGALRPNTPAKDTEAYEKLSLSLADNFNLLASKAIAETKSIIVKD